MRKEEQHRMLSQIRDSIGTLVDALALVKVYRGDPEWHEFYVKALRLAFTQACVICDNTRAIRDAIEKELSDVEARSTEAEAR